MSLSSTLAAYLEPLGIWWPEGEGDALRDVASAWRSMAGFLAETAASLDAATQGLAGSHTGGAADRFTTYWTAWSGPNGYLAVAEEYCGRLAGALEVFATEVDIADRELAAVVEQALGSGGLTPGSVGPVAAASSRIAASLGAAATEVPAAAGVTSMAAVSVAPVQAPATAALEHSASSTAGLVIPGPGPAPDFSTLASAAVDFGNGPGVPPASASRAGDGTVTVTTPYATLTVSPSPAPAMPSGAPVALTPPAPFTPTPAAPASGLPAPAATPLAHLTPAALGLGVPLSPAAMLPAPGPIAAGISWPGTLSDAGRPGTLSDAARPGTLPGASTPVSVPPPGSIVTSAVPAAAGAVAGATAAKVAGKASSTMPFFPMGGMGAGAGLADDADDGRRPRKTR